MKIHSKEWISDNINKNLKLIGVIPDDKILAHGEIHAVVDSF